MRSEMDMVVKDSREVVASGMEEVREKTKEQEEEEVADANRVPDFQFDQSISPSHSLVSTNPPSQPSSLPLPTNTITTSSPLPPDYSPSPEQMLSRSLTVSPTPR